jgi:hypothetical protein
MFASTGVSDGLVPGTIYRFVLVATNAFGDSDQSLETRVALGNLPTKPNPPFKIETLSTNSTIAIGWDRVASDDGIPVLGYILQMDDGFNGDFKTIYDGNKDPITNNFVTSQLTIGLNYRFRVAAVNYNGDSAYSNIVPIFACLVPSKIPQPKRINQSTTSITI